MVHAYVYLFEEGRKEMVNLLGGKGANLCEMSRIGLPVPSGCVITTEACNHYLHHKRSLPKAFDKQLEAALATVEAQTHKRFGDPAAPLLVSARSGAPVSMPGMMETVLNIGLTDKTVEGLAKQSKNPRFAWDAYRRLVHMFGHVVKGIPDETFESLLEREKKRQGVKKDVELDTAALKRVTAAYQRAYQRAVKSRFPQDPQRQLREAVYAVFDSWNIPRAKTYRTLHHISEELGTGVVVQAMVFGNFGPDSGTGVAFTRNPSTGEKKFFGEFLLNAQGEDVVAGIRTPKTIREMKDRFPFIYRQLEEVAHKLEQHYGDMLDLEFTIENGKLYMLQTRSGKRTAAAAVRIAVEMEREALIDRNTAILRVSPELLDQLLHPRIDPEERTAPLAKGLPASPGAATGTIVFTAEEAVARTENGESVLLLRPETTPDDIHGMAASKGVLTARGGMTSHAAVVARGMGKPCVAGCDALAINPKKKNATMGATVLKEGDTLTLDGSTGTVYIGALKLIPPGTNPYMEELLSWADGVRRLGVRANADNPKDAKKARDFGAEGIGLCRTEHMFMAPERLPAVHAMILADTHAARAAALKKLLPMQRRDFLGIFEAMNGLPVTIRLLDPPLHEFLPSKTELVEELASLPAPQRGGGKHKKLERLLHRVEVLSEANPMLGHRGCRLAITFPEVYKMQVRAIAQAAVAAKKKGYKPVPQVMIPLVGHATELESLRRQARETFDKECKKARVNIPYKVGTMIELPRACLVADEIAQHADFFSFGTNDLTQTTFGYSRDDAEGKFMPAYLETGMLARNPFEVLDESGVGQLVKLAVEKGLHTNPSLSLGICGEHGGEPQSIHFCHRVGLKYVSCSPFRVPVARLAAAQAALKS